MPDNPPQTAATGRRQRLLVAALAGAGVALAIALYVGNVTRPAATECPVQQEAATLIDTAATGELAALNGTGLGRGYKDMAFADASGAPISIGSFAGKKLLVNFWASWCVPCREEMPALDALATKYNSDAFAVLPINLDVGAGGLEKAQAFLAEGQWANLPLYADSTMTAFDQLKTSGVTLGLPATLLLDEKGCELGVLQGPARWDSPDGERVIEALLGV